MSTTTDAEDLLGADRAVMARLAAEIPTKDRPGKGGKVWKYVNSAACLNRLDDACGPENWSHELTLMGEIVHCRISITLPSGRIINRSGMSAIVRDKPGAEKSRTLADATKEAASDAFKRACKYLGIARYLWENVGHPTYYRRFAKDLARIKKEAVAREAAQPAPANHPGPDAKPGVQLYQEYCTGPEGRPGTTSCTNSARTRTPHSRGESRTGTPCSARPPGEQSTRESSADRSHIQIPD
jgi:hypothetical protein